MRNIIGFTQVPKPNQLQSLNMSIKYLHSFLPLLVGLFILTVLSQQEMNQDPGMKYLQEYQEAISKMLPTQSFSFDISQGQHQKFNLWPEPDTQKLTLAFFKYDLQNDESSSGQQFYVQCVLNGALVRLYEHQKVGVCDFLPTVRPIIINLSFKNYNKLTTVFVTYDLKKMKSQVPTVPTLEQDNSKKLADTSQKFERVHEKTFNQQAALRNIVKGLGKHQNRMQRNLEYAYHRIVLETVVVILSGVLGLCMIRKQLKSGYELLV